MQCRALIIFIVATIWGGEAIAKADGPPSAAVVGRGLRLPGARRAAKRVAPLPETASPLMKAIYRRAVPVVGRGTVPPELFLVNDSRAHRTVIQHTPNIIEHRAAKIRKNWNQRELLIRSYEWEAEAAGPILKAIKHVEQRRKIAGLEEPMAVRILVDQHPPPAISDTFGLNTYDVGAALETHLDEFAFDPRYVKLEARVHRHFALGSMHSKGAAGDDWVDSESSNYQSEDRLGTNAGFEFTGVGIARTWKSDFDHYWDRASPTQRAAAAGDPFRRAQRRQAAAGVGEKSGRLVEGTASDSDGAPILVVTHRPQGWVFFRGNKSPRNQALYAAFENTDGEINIIAPNLNSHQIRKRILAALERRVRVNIVLSIGFNAEAEHRPFQGGSNYEAIGWLHLQMESRGIPADRLNARWYRDPGVTTPTVDPRVLGYSHIRYMSFASRPAENRIRRVAFTGSTVPDTQSVHHSGETDFVVDDTPVVKQWDDDLFWPMFNHAIPAWPPPESFLRNDKIVEHHINKRDDS